MSAPGDFEWTPEACDRLRKLWAEGLSTSVIGLRMGVSKDAIIGKAHRLQLPARPSPIGLNVSAEAQRSRKMARQAARRREQAAAPPSPAPTIAAKLAARHTAEPDADAIARYIAEKGVTRCPPAALAPTTAVIPPDAASVLRAYREQVEEARRAKHMPAVQRAQRAAQASARSKAAAAAGSRV